MKLVLCLATLPFLVAPLVAAPKKPTVAAPVRKKLHVVGRVLTNGGAPLSGVKVGIYGTTAAGANTRFETVTNANGLYSQRVPDGFYGVSAYHSPIWNGKKYEFTLHPETGTTAPTNDAAPGIVKNFRWKLSGLRPGEVAGEAGKYGESNKYFGKTIYVTSREDGTLQSPIYFPAGSSLIFTLSPTSTQIDGAKASVKTFKRSFATNQTSGISTHLDDIPIAFYNLSVVYIAPDGTRLPLRSRLALDWNAPHQPTTPIRMVPDSYGTVNMIQVQIESPITQK